MARRDAERAAKRAAGEAEARRFLEWLETRLVGCVGDRDRDGDIEGDPYPCVTLRALAKAYGWTDG